MFKYKKMIAFFILSILLIGGGIIYIILADTNVYTSDKTVLTQNKAVKKNYNDIDQKAEVNEKIENLINGYLNAKLKEDMSTMVNYVNDVKLLNEKKIMAQNQYIESYENVKCKIKKCKREEIYRVYVYYDIKAYDIEAGLPSLSAFCVKKENEDYKIYLGKIANNVQKEIEKYDNSDEITALKQSVQKRMNEIISTDEQVRNLFDELK